MAYAHQPHFRLLRSYCDEYEIHSSVDVACDTCRHRMSFTSIDGLARSELRLAAAGPVSAASNARVPTPAWTQLHTRLRSSRVRRISRGLVGNPTRIDGYNRTTDGQLFGLCPGQLIRSWREWSPAGRHRGGRTRGHGIAHRQLVAAPHPSFLVDSTADRCANLAPS